MGSAFRVLGKGVAFVAICLVLFEICCQAYARLVVFPHLDELRENPRHYYRASENEVLGYELRPGAVVEHDGRRLRINRYGIRDEEDDLASDERRVAILGDSVTIGTNISQEKTIPALVQRELDPVGREIKVLNFGLGGYAVEQLLVRLEELDAVFDVDEVVYLLNFNDFARHNSIYEGADNGMYRTYVRPSFMAPFFVRKAIYRMNKGGTFGSVGWYRWLFEGNEERVYEKISEMNSYARAAGFDFSVVLFPSGFAYSETGYEMQDLHDRMGAFLRSEGIPFVSPVEVFARDVDGTYTPTDHLHDAGNVAMARVIADLVRSGDSPAN